MVSPPTSTPLATMTQVRFSMLDSSLIQTVPSLQPDRTPAAPSRLKPRRRFQDFDRRRQLTSSEQAAAIGSDGIGFSRRFTRTKRKGMTWASFRRENPDGFR